MAFTLQPMTRVGLIADGHGHDPDELLADARTWLKARRDMTKVGVREVIPVNARTAEAWFHPSHGFVQPDFPGAVAVTVLDMPPEVIDEATTP